MTHTPAAAAPAAPPSLSPSPRSSFSRSAPGARPPYAMRRPALLGLLRRPGDRRAAPRPHPVFGILMSLEPAADRPAARPAPAPRPRRNQRVDAGHGGRRGRHAGPPRAPPGWGGGHPRTGL